MGWHYEGDKPVKDNIPFKSNDERLAYYSVRREWNNANIHEGGFFSQLIQLVKESVPTVLAAAAVAVGLPEIPSLLEAAASYAGGSAAAAEAATAAASAALPTAAEAFTASELAANAATSAAASEAAGGAAAGLADYGGSANAFANYAAGGAEGDTLGAFSGSQAGSANAYADAAAGGVGQAAPLGVVDGANGGFDPSNINAGPYGAPTNASPYGAGEAPAYDPSVSAQSAAAGGSNNPFGNGSSFLRQLAGKAISPMLGNIGSGIIGANGSRNAANTQANAATQAIALQQGMFNSSQANLQPYINGGANAMGQLNRKLSDGSLGGTFSGADYLANKDPGYQFQLDQGNQALQNSQASKDGVLGGSSLKGLIDYNQGMASTGYQSAYNRWLQSQQNTYGQLSGMANIGNTAASYGASSASNFSKSIGDNITGRGNSLAAGQVGVANNYGRTLNGLGNQLYALSDMTRGATSGPSGAFNGPLQDMPNTNGLGPDFAQYLEA